MSIDDAGTIDVIGIDKTTGEAVLTISDHLEWNDHEHLLLLQGKLNTYLAFIESGEIFESYPEARDRSVRIEVVCKFEPDQIGSEFLLKARNVIRGAGFSLTWRVPNQAPQRTCEDARR